MIELDLKVREKLVQDLLKGLQQSVPGSSACLRGSLAEGCADLYSDIDLLWVIPDDGFIQSMNRLPKILSMIGSVESLRFAPEFQHSDRRRLAFIQFSDVPLFWRVDLEVFAHSIQGNQEYDLDNPLARGEDWSLTHSALMNAVAAIKALLRNQEQEAASLIKRAFKRVGLEVYLGETHNLILVLVEAIAVLDPSLNELSDRIKLLHHQAFGHTGNISQQRMHKNHENT